MRRIYESRALEYDDEDPYAPKRTSDDERSRKPIDWASASHAFVPMRLRPRAVGVSVETDRQRYETDEPVRFRVSFRNRVPFPIALRTDSPVRWTWSIDGVDEASRVTNHPTEDSLFRFSRSETKTFKRSWSQRFRESAQRWEPAGPGEYSLAVRVNVPDADDKGLTAETTFTIE
ncbi:hypothetical protein [Natronomonas gomsonensis]|uniref:hypothetical protein n=1 Tax=Natronomonas gomsonensis TaxID=1046043 RepID=UPI0015C0768E|nr:hypothetical protein [Natronomonas gomsonensis]